MSNIQAAIGCAQLERVRELVDRKREIFAAYKSGLRSIDFIQMNSEPPNTMNGMWMPTIVFDEKACISRERLLLAFREKGIDARNFFWPLSSLPMFTSAPRNKNAWSIPERAINLPSFHDISDESLQQVIAVIKAQVK